MNGQQFFKQLIEKARAGVHEIEESVEVQKAMKGLPHLLFDSGVEMELDRENDRMVFSYMLSKVAVYAEQTSTTKVEMRYEVIEDFDAHIQKLKDFDIKGGVSETVPRQTLTHSLPRDEVWAMLERRLANF